MGDVMLKKLLLLSGLTVGMAQVAFADAVSDKIVANLRAQGFAVLQMDRTWLGRMWVLARNDEVQREVVFNPVTGEILRDYTVLLATLHAPSQDDTQQVVASPAAPVSPPVLGASSPGVTAGAVEMPQVGASDQSVSAPINPVQ